MRPSQTVPLALFVLSLLCGAAAGAALALTGAPQATPVALVAGALLGVFASSSVRVVAEWERMLVLRLGRLRGTRGPGIAFVIPVVDSTLLVEMRTQTVDIAQQQAITADNVPVLVHGVIFFQVRDPEAAAVKVENYRRAIARMSAATLRDAVGTLSLDELLSSQERLESEIARNVERSSAEWGLHVEAIKLEDIQVPEDLKKMMSRQASSEREKRATIIKAEGDRQAADALSAAARTMAQSPGAMHLRTLQSIDGLGPSASNTVVLALPMELVEAMRALGARAPG